MYKNKKGGSVPIVVIYYTGIGSDPLPHLHSPDRFLNIVNEHFKEDNPETHGFDLDQWIEWVGANKIILNSLGSKVIKHKKKKRNRKGSKSYKKSKGKRTRKSKKF